MRAGNPIEPIPNEVFESIGRLCAAWSYLEFATEKMIWGIVGVDEMAGRNLTWGLDLRQRWQKIMTEAPKKHSDEEFNVISEINQQILLLAKDRNIIVHGLVHASVINPVIKNGVVIGGELDRVPAWSIFRGEDGGKSFPVSLNGVQTVISNIQKTTAQIADFNEHHNYTTKTTPSEELQKNWPAAFS